MKNTTLLLALVFLVNCKQRTINSTINQAVVQDYSNFFSVTEEQKLSEKIINYEALTSKQICIYTIDSIPNKKRTLDYATEVANKLGVGTKKKNNGLLLLVSRYDRQIAIATGIGTEKTITDSIASAIIDKTIVPKFKESLYFEGLTIGLDSIFSKWN